MRGNSAAKQARRDERRAARIQGKLCTVTLIGAAIEVRDTGTDELLATWPRDTLAPAMGSLLKALFWYHIDAEGRVIILRKENSHDTDHIGKA